MKFVALFFSALCFLIAVLAFFYAFYVTGWESTVFGFGVVMMSMAIFLPIHVLKTHDEE